MNHILLTKIVLVCFDYRYGRSVRLSHLPCVQKLQTPLIARLKVFRKLNFVDASRPWLKIRLWTIKFKRTDVVIKAILIWIWPKSFNNDLRSKMHQFSQRFLKHLPRSPYWWGGKPVDAFGIFGSPPSSGGSCSTPSAVPISKPFRRPCKLQFHKVFFYSQ